MIETRWDNSIASILFNRPEKKNALTPPMLSRFVDEVVATQSKARAVVIGGVGDAFCSGFDLSLCESDPTALESLLRGLTAAILALRRHPSPVLIAAHGAAIAGGCALLGGADIALSNADAKLGYPVVLLGISPGVSGPFLAAAVGSGNARARMLDPRLISGRDALNIGLVHECLATPSEVLPRAASIAAELAGKPRSGMESTKSWLNELDHTTDDQIASAALHASLALVGTPEQRERLAKALAR